MKKGDFYWGLALLVWVVILVNPTTRTSFITFTDAHAYIGGFGKFFILATMGDMLGIRIRNNAWSFPVGVVYRAIVWGILGIFITLVFTVFAAGVATAQTVGRLPFASSTIMHAFFTSAIMNMTFGPVLFLLHKFSDTFIDMKYEKKGETVTFKAMVERIDWYNLFSSTMFKQLPFFWIPCHTLVFLLPAQYRVLASAFLSIALGLLLALTKKTNRTSKVSA